MTQFIYFFLCFWWVMVILYKWKVQGFFIYLANKTGKKSIILSNFFEKLSNCEFCIENWVCLALSLSLWVIYGDNMVLAYIIPITALSNILKSLRHY